ncbi:pentapeptide repeat-containing protein [Nocardia sp. KC 131]|uniref:pentapeptide repeat-containing protein n=1 Tax=Nocardia arseniciresistens TaxID=3392119 RepID=UPI00398EF182
MRLARRSTSSRAGADVSGADFLGTKLEFVNFGNANLTDAELGYADFRCAASATTAGRLGPRGLLLRHRHEQGNCATRRAARFLPSRSGTA